MLFFFLPQVAVVTYCAQLWPFEGGVYQWAKFAIGPMAGFMSAWNYAFYAVFLVSGVGIQAAGGNMKKFFSHLHARRTAVWLDPGSERGWAQAWTLGYSLRHRRNDAGRRYDVGVIGLASRCDRRTSACESTGSVRIRLAGHDAAHAQPLCQGSVQRVERPGAGRCLCRGNKECGAERDAFGLDRGAGRRRDLRAHDELDVDLYAKRTDRSRRTNPTSAGCGIGGKAPECGWDD